MILSYLLFTLYILLYIWIYFRVSKLNKSFFNSYTVAFASALLIRLMPFMLSMGSSNYDQAALNIFILVLFASLIGGYFGYRAGFRLRIPHVYIPPQTYAKKSYKGYLILSILAMIGSFFLLGYLGIGIKMWIFNNRMAYMLGRNGNGIWYILYQLNIIFVAILILCIANNRVSRLQQLRNIAPKDLRVRSYLWYLIPVVAAYFTGSKGFLLGILILFLFFYDAFEKKIKLGKIALAGIAGFGMIAALLYIQSGMTLQGYSDYYSQFIRFISYANEGNWSFAYGRIQMEELLWKLVPRALYPDKPYVYGQIQIVNLFYSYESIAEGNTPSFSEFIVPYADFGILGVFVSAVFAGLFQGFVERIFRNEVFKYGASFNVVLVYTTLFLVAPVNFSRLYLLIFLVILYIIQKFRLGIRTGYRLKKTRYRIVFNGEKRTDRVGE